MALADVGQMFAHDAAASRSEDIAYEKDFQAWLLFREADFWAKSGAGGVGGCFFAFFDRVSGSIDWI